MGCLNNGLILRSGVLQSRLFFKRCRMAVSLICASGKSSEVVRSSDLFIGHVNAPQDIIINLATTFRAKITSFLQKSIVMNFQFSSWIKQPLFVEKWVSEEGNYLVPLTAGPFRLGRLRGIYWRLSIASLWIHLGFKGGKKWFVFSLSNMKVIRITCVLMRSWKWGDWGGQTEAPSEEPSLIQGRFFRSQESAAVPQTEEECR